MRFSGLGHGLRATIFDEPEQALTGLGGIDLVPEPGSKAAAYEEKIRAHPRRYAAIQTALGVAKVVVPIIVALLLARLAFRLPLPTGTCRTSPGRTCRTCRGPTCPAPTCRTSTCRAG